jgi:rSAM/selenodomain-associated transferase 1
MRPTLVVFVREPRPGRVKTRLAREIGAVEAAWWFRHASAALIRRLAGDRRWRTVLAVTPDAEGLASRAWAPGLLRAGQGPGDLGRRMTRFLRREPGTGLPPAPVAIVGADIPDLRPVHVLEAFRVLRRHEAVLGPATDGGYWLFGLRRPVPRDLLSGVRWSTPHAMADTVARLSGLSVGFAATLMDVDTAGDLAAVRPPGSD